MDDEIMVSDVVDRSRYEARVDGKLAGFVEYQLEPGRILFLHTETEDGFEGKGVGSRLASGALDDARKRGLVVVPLCPFVAGYIERHPDYGDLVAR
jgi:predicted GNAT family acetyltransferase